MPKKNFNTQLVDIDGQPAFDDKKKPTLVKTAVVNALLGVDDCRDGEEKAGRYDLAMRIHKAAAEVDVTPEEIVMIKAQVGKFFPALIVGQIFNLVNE